MYIRHKSSARVHELAELSLKYCI